MAVIEIKVFREYLKRHAEFLVLWEDYEPQPSEAHSQEVTVYVNFCQMSLDKPSA